MKTIQNSIQNIQAIAEEMINRPDNKNYRLTQDKLKNLVMEKTPVIKATIESCAALQEETDKILKNLPKEAKPYYAEATSTVITASNQIVDILHSGATNGAKVHSINSITTKTREKVDRIILAAMTERRED